MRSLPALLLLLAAIPAQALACGLPRGQVQQADFYYELGSSSLNAAGVETLEAVVARSRGCQVIFIVSGHIDANELQANPGLGQARAEDVRTRLQARSFAPGDILVRDLAFSRPAIPTGPGSREPLNRRAELFIVVL